MTTEQFIAKYGSVPQRVTKNFNAKSLSGNYATKDAIIEFCDNAMDSRVGTNPICFTVEYNESERLLICSDNGSGIRDFASLFTLGGTDKEHNKQTIGKYGIGFCGATAAIAVQCKYDTAKPVDIIIKSKCDNCKPRVQRARYDINNDIIISDVSTEDVCYDTNKHYTRISFENVRLSDRDISTIIKALEETFEESISTKKLIISFIKGNGTHRTLGESIKSTFTEYATKTKLRVGKFEVIVKHETIDAERFSDEKAIVHSGIRIYDKYSGRMLANELNLWKWYGNRSYQPSICGLRVGIYIDSSIECYNKFGIKSTKNGVSYKDYFNDPDFKELSEKLKEIYQSVDGGESPNKVSVNSSFQIEDMTFKVVDKKKFADTDYKYEVLDDTIIKISQKITTHDYAKLVTAFIELQKKYQKVKATK